MLEILWDVIVLGGLVAIPVAFVHNGRRNRRIRENREK